MATLSEWIGDKSSDEWQIYVKRLSANDTGATGGHQVGIYLPKEAVAVVLPSVAHTNTKNPDCYFRAVISSHSFPEQTLRAVYYNGKHFDGTRDEHRVTQWNTGVSGSPVQDHENTGALALFAFHVPSAGTDADYLDVWVCKGLEEEENIEAHIGEIVPGLWLLERGDLLFGGFVSHAGVVQSQVRLPDGWEARFPSGEEIIAYLPQAFRLRETTPDKLIIERRDNEYKLFRQVEELHVLDQIRRGFTSVDDFMQLANSVSNRRKSRSGKSLEIHLEHLFRQFGLESFGTQCTTEGRKKPDFIFPSCRDYHDTDFPAEKLRMLAVKTTCKDRWRQVLNEANRIDEIHLFTLQEGVSQHQFDEMRNENVKLVVPAGLHKKYPEEVRGNLLTLDGFIQETKGLYA